MKITSKFALAALTLALSAAGTSAAHAQGLGISVQADINANVDANVKSTTSVMKADKSTTTRGNASTTASTTGERGSVVSAFVKSLLSVADREGGIGAQVRAVAQSQNDSASTTAAAKAKVESRGSVRTFLAGSDYKNLKVIRNEIATTTANIARLKDLRDQAVDAAVRAELSVQIQALEAELATVNAFVEAREEAFSIFGWFSKLFVR